MTIEYTAGSSFKIEYYPNQEFFNLTVPRENVYCYTTDSYEVEVGRSDMIEIVQKVLERMETPQ
jgi:hypothetical protein